MTEQRLKVESGPPQHVIAEAQERSGDETGSAGAKDKAQQVAAPAKEKAQEIADRAQRATGPVKEKARAVAGQAKEQAQAVAGHAKTKAAAQVDERSTQFGQQIGAQADSLGGVAEELRRQGQEGPAKVAEQVSRRIKDAGSYLEQTDGESLVQAAADAARENPAAAAVVGAAAGFVAGRVIKASREGASEEDESPPSAGEGGA
ncbi:MAG TPA: hypothetical protein VGO71_11060 [Baekduia sp.]|jgi:ElaB/YqjD/DUF883 family membrane-anchored ribosome-binding protein|nr:hypothetical protein [Baekduia sp.]